MTWPSDQHSLQRYGPSTKQSSRLLEHFIAPKAIVLKIAMIVGEVHSNRKNDMEYVNHLKIIGQFKDYETKNQNNDH